MEHNVVMIYPCNEQNINEESLGEERTQMKRAEADEHLELQTLRAKVNSFPRVNYTLGPRISVKKIPQLRLISRSFGVFTTSNPPEVGEQITCEWPSYPPPLTSLYMANYLKMFYLNTVDKLYSFRIDLRKDRTGLGQMTTDCPDLPVSF